MSIVSDFLEKHNYSVSDEVLTEEILKHKELDPIDLWLLPQYPFDQWRRKYDYPRLLANIKERQNDFVVWMSEQGITDTMLLEGYFSDYFNHKPLSENKTQYLIKTTYQGKSQLQVWENYSGQKSMKGDGEQVIYELIKEFVSYYDWKLAKNENFSFIDTFHTSHPNTKHEQVYLNHNIRLLKMGGLTPPVNSIGVLLRGKKLEFVNCSDLEFNGTICFGDMGNLEYNHCTVDHMKCSELEFRPGLHFETCLVRNLQIRNSSISGWIFITCQTTGNIMDSKLSSLRVFGGQFTPIFNNCDLGYLEVKHKGVAHNRNFEKTYRTLSKCAKDSGNKELGRNLKIRELDFIRERKTGIKKFWMLLDKVYWEYGEQPKRLVIIMCCAILAFGIFYSFFPESFSNHECGIPYWETLLNSLYYSAVTFTTLGYGDISPAGFMRLFAAIEAVFGAITVGFLVAGLAKED